MSIDQILFWALTVVALIGALMVYRVTKGRKVSIVKSVTRLNHILFILLPFMVLCHLGEYLKASGSLFERAERIVFPVYLWALISHIVINWTYFQKKDFD